jgi:hypothetical protein
MPNRRLLRAEILFRWHQLLPTDVENLLPDGPQLVELLVARYGFCRERAEREVNSFLADFAERLHRAIAA